MRVPLSWLGECVDLAPGTTPEDVHAALVSVGLEEEDIHRFELSGPIVVGEVLEFVGEPQKNGKTINWCQVRVAPGDELAADGGPAIHGIVCGAHNFVVGSKVVVTLPGAVLPGPFPIAPRTTYGHVSDGMIASARELGLGDEHDGILLLSSLGLDDAEVGTDAIALLGLDDSAVEINVTPDRGYAFSIRGVAREYAHATGAAFRDPAFGQAGFSPSTVFPVVVDDEAPIRGRVGASVFITRAVRGVEATRPTPAWMVSRLGLAGIRSISLVVDVTNYVMIELGQPLHGYDLDKLTGGITVRRAQPGEKITTLDDAVRTLTGEDLLITDESGPIGLAGVMGGANTEIDSTSVNVLVEAANFDPVSIARSARRHKSPSEASRRFERGVDPAVAPAAAARVVQLLVELAGGVADGLGSVYDESPAPVAIHLPTGFISGLIGLEYTGDEVRESLTEIGTMLEESDGDLLVTPPTWRPDLTDKWTLAEEVARIVGYDRIPSVLPVAPPGRGFTRSQTLRRAVSQTLAATGHTEVLAYPFVSPTANAEFGGVAQIRLANPMDGAAPFLRTTLLPGLLHLAHRNRSRGLVDLSIYEQGLVFQPEARASYGIPVVPPGAQKPSVEVQTALNAGIPPQPLHLGVVLVGNTRRHQPGHPATPAGWQDALAAVAQVSLATGVAIQVRQGSRPGMHPGRTAELFVTTLDAAELVVGFAGEILPSIAKDYDLPSVVAVAEVNLDSVIAQANSVVSATEIRTKPAATQDLSLVVGVEVPAGELRAAVIEGAGELLERIDLVDDYRGAGIEPGQKSLTFALRFRAPDRTLTAAEASEARLAGVALASARFGATLRE
ncbi:phenylalanyl-tRNA synthetase subunit beta [Cryobacterium roopkundense]|uniref:Phenylalanine--tRNA ligase beta subunit n=1 Tax=Cryobacterium roopkundense TaxID=1001240 RepID=A0A099JLE1_9MICO|nr:phenylalanine--tRNA ligase subunit beta [Cryobacterium roopkundense]KGJ79006.1 phenylalanyl-tRNA synthetase subunit beta [Cryobacterium roopkundense]MBB5640387.1 phenylalanyl-tRNA synthetase beta chain [Cryobacterium roopkundense]